MFFLILSFIAFLNFSDFLNMKFILNKYMVNQFLLEFSLDKKMYIFLFILLLIVFSISLFKKYYMMSDYNSDYFNFLFFWFVFSMIMILISQNWIIMLIGWDMLGVSSYLLIVFYNNMSSSNSGYATMNTNRFGDVFLMTFLVLSLNLNNINFMNKWSYLAILLTICLLTKSAQFPFSSWLPLAMAAPTPVSSLVHSSTLVTAGLFIFYKTDMLFNNNIFVMLFLISLWTNLFSGMMAISEMDMKKMIALSTLSQISFMTLALSMGMIYLSFLHLLTHAIFKASLFFWAGMNMHSNKNEQNFLIFNMKSSKISQSFLFLIMLSLVGFPISIGFYSKDQILDLMKPMYSLYNNFIFIFCIFLTIFYTIRYMKKMTSMNFNKFFYNMIYFNVYHTLMTIMIFSFMLLNNKNINELWFKTSFMLTTLGWKTMFIFMLLLSLNLAWYLKLKIKKNFIFKMIYLNFFTLKILTLKMKKNFKVFYFDFGWTNKITVLMSNDLIFWSKYLMLKNIMLMFVFFFGFFLMTWNS